MRFVFVLVLFGFLPPPGLAYASSGVRSSSLWRYDWSTKTSPNLAERRLSGKDIATFVTGLRNALDDSEDSAASEICSFDFADLRHNGTFSLIIGFGVPGRPSCNAVSIVDRTASGFESFWSGGANGSASDLRSSIQDLRHDGNLELLLDSGLAAFPQRCAANWTTIFAWTGANYTNVSDRFKSFYKQRLDALNKAIPALGPDAGPDGYSLRDKECLEAEASAIQRFLGVSRDAGTEQAIRLAASADPLAREFGAQLLSEIGTPESRKYLEKLATDSNVGVRISAKYGLSTAVSAFGAESFVQDGSVALHSH